MPYKTVRGPASGSVTIEKSEFIARIAPVSSADEAAGFIENVKANNRRARHNCYAYTLKSGLETRYSDDGEPQGTAGAPILDVLKKSELTDVCIVVTRYFGGILLGKGGLTRAYSSAASKAVEAAKIKYMCDACDCELRFEYPFYDKITRMLPDFEVKTVSQDFGEDVCMKLLIKSEKCDDFKKVLREMSNGRVVPKFSEMYCADFG